MKQKNILMVESPLLSIFYYYKNKNLNTYLIKNNKKEKSTFFMDFLIFFTHLMFLLLRQRILTFV